MSHKSTFGDATNYTEFEPDGRQILHGTARVERHWRIPAARFKLPATNYPAPGLVGIFDTLDFDKSTEESARETDIVPYRWDKSTDIETIVNFTHATNITGVVRWGIEYIAVKATESLVGATTTIYQNCTVAADTEEDLITQLFTTKILAANLEIGDEFAIRIFRDTSNEDDTLNEDAALISVHYHFIMNRLGQSV